eukprot:2589359-Rhodomonas_salina.1
MRSQFSEHRVSRATADVDLGLEELEHGADGPRRVAAAESVAEEPLRALWPPHQLGQRPTKARRQHARAQIQSEVASARQPRLVEIGRGLTSHS